MDHIATVGSMITAERLRDSWNSHTMRNLVGSVRKNYRSIQPTHPSRGFVGRSQVPTNWSAVFDGVPDFTAELVAGSLDVTPNGPSGEWSGIYTSGTAFLMRGITILTLRDGLIAKAQLYLEPVDVTGGDIDTAVQDL
jgi:hypothetical protein